MYDMPELHRQMLEVLGIEDVDAIVPDSDDIKAVDPVTAVQNLINGKPVKAFMEQTFGAPLWNFECDFCGGVVLSFIHRSSFCLLSCNWRLSLSPFCPSVLPSRTAWINSTVPSSHTRAVSTHHVAMNCCFWARTLATMRSDFIDAMKKSQSRTRHLFLL